MKLPGQWQNVTKVSEKQQSSTVEIYYGIMAMQVPVEALLKLLNATDSTPLDMLVLMLHYDFNTFITEGICQSS